TLTLERSGEKKPLDVKVQLDGEPVRIGIAWRVDDAEPGTVILTRVVPASPAARGGLQIGDRIYGVAGRHFNSSDEFLRLLGGARDSIELDVGHEGQLHKATLAAPAPGHGTVPRSPPKRPPSTEIKKN